MLLSAKPIGVLGLGLNKLEINGRTAWSYHFECGLVVVRFLLGIHL
jgi:hypothetical protein